jgi:hypothetical protein
MKLWDKLDDLPGKQRKDLFERPANIQDFEDLGLLPMNTEHTRRRIGSVVKFFSEWIENEVMVKWTLMYDTDGSRYNIITTNFAEVYNWVMRGV